MDKTMKKSIILSLVITMSLLSACDGNAQNTTGDSRNTFPPLTSEEIRYENFTRDFQEIKPEEIQGNVFSLVGNDYTVITSGSKSILNSMVASFGGWGMLFYKPVTWCFLRADRYTLEKIREEQTYTMAYFDEKYKENIMVLGSKTGRDSNKMNETGLIRIPTPDGNMTYQDAKLVIECKLVQITTVSPDDFYTEEGHDFVMARYAEAGDYNKIVVGEIIRVWIKR